MALPSAHDLTRLLDRLRDGDTAAASALFELLYADIKRRAQRIAADANATLQPTALVHEAWLKLVPERAPTFADRAHFLRAAAAAMRSVLVDHIRARNTRKRGGAVAHVDVAAVADIYEQRAIDLLGLDEAMRRLAEFDPQLAQIVELRFFAGVPAPEIAAVIGVSASTVERGWRTACAWLRAELDA
ncbi:MAG: sigma-70 family RNA polymerase sigma factor [Planctomycetes bacterium]|nr:sigma-70 family RNA polymerase sigma factor [Planctomycetota bacterium]